MTTGLPPYCKDCRSEGVTAHRPIANGSGGRCATHWRIEKKRRRERNQELRWESTYSITREQYEEIKERQGGRCAICRKATGAKKALAVDHDHSCCPGKTSCGKCVRSLLCTPCNRFIGHIGDDPEVAERLLLYLIDPPGKDYLDEWRSAQ